MAQVKTHLRLLLELLNSSMVLMGKHYFKKLK